MNWSAISHADLSSLTAILEFGTDLRPVQIEDSVNALLSTEVMDGEKVQFLKALRTKGETTAEIVAFTNAVLKHAVNPGIDPARVPGPMLDVCGTGGDKLELFNVSTTSMFVLAGGGACIVKHGNRAITSKCGGADVLEGLGVKIELPPDRLRACVEEHGCGFIFAPAYHPTFKILAPVRKMLAAKGIPTIFNLVGPLLNPVQPAHQLVGIFAPEMLPRYIATLAALHRKSAWVIHGTGMDELSLSGPSEIHEVREGSIRDFTVTPEELGLKPCALEDLKGGDCAQNGHILTSILDGTERGPKRDMVVLNAAAGFVVAGLSPDLPTGIQRANESIDRGDALKKLQALQAFV